MFRKGLLLVLLLTFALAVVACGGNDGADPAPAPTENGGQAPEEGATGGDATNDQAMTLYNANCMACHATDLAGAEFPKPAKRRVQI